MATSRRVAKKRTIQPVAEEKKDSLGGLCYCRRCMKLKNPTAFHGAVNHVLDSNGKMSICKDCVSEIFTNNYILASENMELAALETCRTLDIKYDQTAFSNTIAHYQNSKDSKKTMTIDGFFGAYKAKLLTMQPTAIGEDAQIKYDLTFSEPKSEVIDDIYKDFEVGHDVKEFWGSNYTPEEYDFLEKQFREWTTRHDVRTKEQEISFKYLSQLQLDYEHKRAKKESVSAILKDIQKAMDVAGVSPNKAKEVNTSRSFTAFSDFIKTIEETEPAEYYKDKPLFADFDNISQYCEDFITRPLLNFLGQQPPDFYVKEDGEGGHGGDLISELRSDEYDEDDSLPTGSGGM